MFSLAPQDPGTQWVLLKPAAGRPRSCRHVELQRAQPHLPLSFILQHGLHCALVLGAQLQADRPEVTRVQRGSKFQIWEEK